MKRALAIMIALAVATPVQAQVCVTPAEAEGLALVAMPDIIRETGRVCAAALPANSLVRRDNSAFLAKYQAEADRAWPSVKATIAKVTDPTVSLLLDSDFARPMLSSLLVPQLVGRIAVSDCGTIDRLVTLLEPLPPRNTAGIVVTTLAYLKAEKAKGRNVAVPDLPLCTTRRR